MFEPKVYTEEELEIFRTHLDNQDSLMRIQSSHYAAIYKEKKIKIIVPVSAIKNRRHPYALIGGKVRLVDESHPRHTLETDCFVAYGRWEKILPELTGETVDIVDHFNDFCPKNGTGIGLFTCQNGIQNSLEDFVNMCTSIIEKLSPENPLFIGLYNPVSRGLISILDDLSRLQNEWAYNPVSVYTLRQMFATFSELLSQASPYILRWVHVAHSEGGLLSNKSLTNAIWGVSQEVKQLMQRHLITLVYGGVDSIPDDSVSYAINTYSAKDIALRFAQPYLDKLPPPEDRSKTSTTLATRKADQEKRWIKEYPHKSTMKGRTMTVVACITQEVPTIEGDHGFKNNTYQAALQNDVDELRKGYRICFS